MGAFYGYSLSKAALAALEGIPKKQRAQIVAKLKRLLKEPVPPGAKRIIGMMDGENPIYRLRSGDYRALYSIRPGPEIIVLDIGDRKNIYKGMKK